jgi:hypothetical protein
VRKGMLSLAHFTGWGYESLLSMDIEELIQWITCLNEMTDKD